MDKIEIMNERILSLLSYYLNECSTRIDVNMVKRLKESCAISDKEAFSILLAIELGIDFDENEERKTDFALDLILGDISDNYQVPSYIEKGLVWLNGQSKAPDSVKVKKKLRRPYKKRINAKTDKNTGGDIGVEQI